MAKIKGSEKLKHGYSAITIFIKPGVIAAGVNIPLPTWAQGAQDLLQLVLGLVSNGTLTGATTEYTIVAAGTGSPATGEASLFDENNIRLGDATTALNWIMVTLKFRSFKVNL